MRILVVHNLYQQPGGEDVVFEAEKALLQEYGHEVIEYLANNDEVDRMGKLKLAANTIWSREAHRALSELIARTNPEIAHFHNTFTMISPSGYDACQKAGVPVVQTLHNYRMFCPAATFYRDGHICQDCMGKLVPYPSVVHACYRDSRTVTAVVAGMITTHKVLRTWHRQIDRFITMTEFGRQKFIEAGLDDDKITVKPHFLGFDPGVGQSGDYALYVGRFTVEKGILTLLKAWAEEGLSGTPLKLVGDGILMDEARALVQSSNLQNVELLGRRSRDEVLALMKGARCLIFPSEWYETFGNVAMEAFACGVPVITTGIGAQGSVVGDGRTGWHFRAGDKADLAAKVRTAFSPETDFEAMRQRARQEYETKYTPERNYEMLMAIYNGVTVQR